MAVAVRDSRGGSALDGVGHGSVLAGRYRLEDRQLTGADGSMWRATDETLERQVSVRVLRPGHPFAADVVDAARRAALVDDPRLARVLDVGQSDGKTYIVSEHVQGRALGDLLAIGPLPAETVRRIAGEAAQALERAGARGLHHLRLSPSSVIVQPDGSIKLVGTAVEAAVAGAESDNAVAASRADAVGLVSIVYAGLTGRWPGGTGTGGTGTGGTGTGGTGTGWTSPAGTPAADGGLGPAPRVTGRAVPPGELVAGVPNDLDTLCSVTLGPNDDGPHSPAELAEQLSPWAQPQPLTDPGGLILSSPSRPLPALAQARSGSPAATPRASDAAPEAASEAAPAMAPVDLRTPAPALSRLPVDTPPSISLPAAGSPRAAGSASSLGSASSAAAAGSVGSAGAAGSAGGAANGRAAAGPGSSGPAPRWTAAGAASQATPGTWQAAAPSSNGAPAADRAAAPSAPAPATSDPTSPAPSTPATTSPDPTSPPLIGAWQPVVRAPGFPPPPSPARGFSPDGAPRVSDLELGGQAWPTPAPAARSTAPPTAEPAQGGYAQHYNDLASEILGDPGARGVRRLEPAPAPNLGPATERAPAWADDWGPFGGQPGMPVRPAPSGPNPQQTRVVLAVLIALVVLGLILAALGLRGLFTSGDATSRPTPSAGASRTPSSPASSAPSTAPSGAASAAQIAGILAIDPQGDGSEYNSTAPKAIDGDPATYWQSERYNSPTFAGTNKTGVGLVVDLGSRSRVTEVTIDHRGSGGAVELRTNTDPVFAGSTVAGSGTLNGGKLVLPLATPATTRYVVLWFTKVTRQPNGENRLVIDEVSVR